MKVECPYCSARGHSGGPWHATGRFFANRHDRRLAELRCDRASCQKVFSSRLPEALAAGKAMEVEPEILAPMADPDPLVVPQPSLPLPTTPPRSQSFVSTQELARRVKLEGILDFKRRQSGDR